MDVTVTYEHFYPKLKSPKSKQSDRFLIRFKTIKRKIRRSYEEFPLAKLTSCGTLMWYRLGMYWS